MVALSHPLGIRHAILAIPSPPTLAPPAPPGTLSPFSQPNVIQRRPLVHQVRLTAQDDDGAVSQVVDDEGAPELGEQLGELQLMVSLSMSDEGSVEVFLSVGPS